MKRLLILPAVAAVCVAEMWRKGLVWPIATTFYRVICPEPSSGNTEADLIG